MRSNTYRIVARHVLVPMFIFFSVGALAVDRGSVTAIASLSSQVSAFVGFSSGAVLYCTRKGGCTELVGTRRSPVTTIDIPRASDSIRVWVGYEDGSVLFCTLTGGCVVQDLQAEQQMVPNRSSGGVKSRVPGEMK